MAIFNSYVKLPEGIDFQTFQLKTLGQHPAFSKRKALVGSEECLGKSVSNPDPNFYHMGLGLYLLDLFLDDHQLTSYAAEHQDAWF